MSRDNSRIVVVTGASRGIGAATAAAFARLGDTVFANHPDLDADHHRQGIETWRDEQGIAAERVIPIAADVASSERVNDLFETVEQHSGRLDVLVNNAGINRDRTVAKMTDEQWHAVLNVNLSGSFFCCRSAVSRLVDSGRIISISSLAAHTGNFGVANYSASKAGVLALTKTLALELAPRQITVNAICPGFIDTDMTRGMPEHVLQGFRDRIPLKRLGSTQDIAATIVFLASAEAGYITGQAISVNGGVHMPG